MRAATLVRSCLCWPSSIKNWSYHQSRAWHDTCLSMSTSAREIEIERLWPQLAGKQTCADEVAGKAIRKSWAAESDEVGESKFGACELERRMVEYADGDTSLTGFFVRPKGEGVPDVVPGVLLAHTAVGPQEDFMLWKVEAVARLGYAAFALDMFGTGGALWDEKESLAERRFLTEDRRRMQRRALAALNTLRHLSGVDAEKIAAIGYCFGGMAVLDLARMGAPPGLQAVATLHGSLPSIMPGAGRKQGEAQDVIRPKVLVLHAEADPFVPPEQVRAFREEASERGASIEIIQYEGAALHAFTRPEKTSERDRSKGMFYDREADEDSWRRVKEFLREQLS